MLWGRLHREDVHVYGLAVCNSLKINKIMIQCGDSLVVLPQERSISLSNEFGEGGGGGGGG